MGAITSVPREVVPPVNHSPGFAVLRGSGVLSQTDIPSSWGLPGPTAAGERSRRLLVPPAPLLCSLPPSFGEQAGWGCVKPVCCMNWCGPLLLGRWPERDKDCSPLLKSLAMCHTVLGLSREEQNLLLCETAQVAKSCLPPPPWVTRLWQRLEPGSQWHRNLLPWLSLQPILEETLRRLPRPLCLCQRAATPLFSRPSYS